MSCCLTEAGLIRPTDLKANTSKSCLVDSSVSPTCVLEAQQFTEHRHAVPVQQLVKKLSFVVVALAADWSWQNQTLERLGESMYVAEAIVR